MKNKIYRSLITLITAAMVSALFTGCHQATTLPASVEVPSEDSSENMSTLPSENSESAAESAESENSSTEEALPETEAQPSAPAFSIKEKEADVYIQYGAYYYALPSAPSDNTNRVGTLEKGTPIHMIGTVDSYEGQPTTWRGKIESWVAFSVTGVTYFVPSEYVADKAPITNQEPAFIPQNDQSATQNDSSASQSNLSVPQDNPPVFWNDQDNPVTEPAQNPEPVSNPVPQQSVSASPYTPTSDPYSTITANQIYGMSDRKQNFYLLGLQVAAGEKVSIQPSDFDEFLEFYAYNVRLGQGTETELYYWLEDDGSMTVWTDETCSLADRYSLIIQKYGAVVYPGDEQKTVKETIRRLRKSITYDSAYRTSDLSTCISASRGVCWFYADCLTVLLNYEGIPCHTIVGDLDGGGHGWNRAYINGSWVDLDPTNTDYGLCSNSSYVEDYPD